MDFIGFFCMGLFVGSILCYGLKLMADVAGYLKIVGAIFTAACGGIVFAFLKFLPSTNTGSVHAYPLGLLLALLWSYLPLFSKSVIEEMGVARFLSVLAIIGLVVVTIFAVLLIAPKAYYEVYRSLTTTSRPP